MAKKKKQESNIVGWVLLGGIGLGILQFGVLEQPGRSSGSARPAVASSPAGTTSSSAAPLDAPRYVAVASLNVRHAPGEQAPLITALPRGSALRVLDRQEGWLLVDLGPSLEGWVAEHLTTTSAPQQQGYLPPARVPRTP